MNTATILKRLLVCTLLTTGCEFLDDIADTDGHDDSSDESGGDEDDNGEEGDEGDDGEEGEAGEAGNDGNGDAGEGGSADESGEADGAGESEGEGGSEGEPSDDAGAACEPDTMACLDELTIGVCVDGEVYALDCNDACVESGYLGALGCFYDDEAASDLCWCDDGSGGGAGGA